MFWSFEFIPVVWLEHAQAVAQVKHFFGVGYGPPRGLVESGIAMSYTNTTGEQDQFIDRHISAIHTASVTLDELTGILGALDDRVSELTDRNTVLEEENQSQAALLAQRDGGIRDLEDKLSEVSDQESKLAQAEAEIADRDNTIRRLEARIEELETQIVDSQ